MTRNISERAGAPAIGRRRFVQGLTTAGVLAVSGGNLRPARAATRSTVLSGTEFALEIGPVPVNITGRNRIATGVNGGLPAPTLRSREGDTLTLSVSNKLEEPTSIHWHGIRVPTNMDGVPGLSFAGIPPGRKYVYHFPVHQSGTYWYHSHSAFQEQTGLYGALVVEPRAGWAQPFDRDYVVLLSDWTDSDPSTIVSNLKFQSDYYNFGQRTVGTFLSDVRRHGLAATVSDRLMWGNMRMSPTDILDVTGATYTYLVNGLPPAANWTALFRPGERVRLRFINGSSMSIFDVRIPGLQMMVVEADGNAVEPVMVDEFRISVAETYDVIVRPEAERAYTIFAQAEDRSGYARGTLAPRAGMVGAIPAVDPRPLLTMVDMGMAHGTAGMSMDHGAMSDMKMDHGSMSGMAPNKNSAGSMNMDHGSMPGMSMDHGSMNGMAPNQGSMGNMNMDHGSMPGMKMDHGSMPGMEMEQKSGPALTTGVQVDNVAMAPTERIDQPGKPLDSSGRRALTYADLRAVRPGDDPRPPSREITLHLTGNMERFIWGFNGKKFSEVGPIRLQRGERVRFVLINDTMMAHPIHLHGLWSELENGHGEFRPYKHTINVKPGERLTYLVTADEPGRWAYHCHLLYHMDMGMFREVRVA